MAQIIKFPVKKKEIPKTETEKYKEQKRLFNKYVQQLREEGKL